MEKTETNAICIINYCVNAVKAVDKKIYEINHNLKTNGYRKMKISDACTVFFLAEKSLQKEFRSDWPSIPISYIWLSAIAITEQIEFFQSFLQVPIGSITNQAYLWSSLNYFRTLKRFSYTNNQLIQVVVLLLQDPTERQILLLSYGFYYISIIIKHD